VKRERWTALVCGSALLATLATLGAACGGSSGNGDPDAGDARPAADANTEVDAAKPKTDADGKKEASHPKDTGPPPLVVYAESPNTLYKLDPATNAVAIIAPFTGDCAKGTTTVSPITNCTTDCCDVTDLAVDEKSNAYVTTFSALYSVDLATAVTTLIHTGSYPNSLSFVPKGTLDDSVEALVGYNGAAYVRIDPTTGAVANVGNLSGGYLSSGDIVSVIGGGTFLTVRALAPDAGVDGGDGDGDGGADTECSASDCLLQIDPKTGDFVQNYGTVGHTHVFGIAYWAGTVFGFDDLGEVFSIAYAINSGGGMLVTAPITVPSPPAGLEFWGAGSTTSAPKAGADGGGIPIK
jgi:hypothetical protein